MKLLKNATSMFATLWTRCRECVGNMHTNVKQQGVGYYMRPPRHVKFLAWILLIGLVSFSLIRLTLLWRNHELLDSGIPATTSEIFYALFTGVRFDLVLVYYLLIPGMLLLAIGQFMGRHARWMHHATIAIMSLGFSLSLMCCIGDIPFFEYTGTHVNAMGIRYATGDTSQALDVVFGNPEYLVFFIVAILASLFFTLAIILLARRYRTYEPSERRSHAAIYLVLLIALMPLTSRGMAFQRAPMMLKDSIISNNNFINQLCVNPVIPFVESLLSFNDKNIHLMDSEEARAYVIAEYGRGDDFTEHVEAHESPWRNVVFILQEGNGAARLARNGDTNGLLPNLDRLINEGIFYENAFSTSTHTSYGIYSTVTSMPPYMQLHPLEDGYRQNLHSIFDQLQQSGQMNTHFFITHEPEFDNVGGFITLQGFGHFMSRDDYGVKTEKAWGVDDHIMFDAALEYLDEDYANGKPFACVCLTTSNHIPFDPPCVDGFTTTHPDNIEFHSIQYADWAMNRFLEMCKEREWFDETLFVITADHGRGIEGGYTVPESCVHIPLLFYSPKHITPEVRNDLVSQMDIVPTAMSMIGVEYDNHSFGIDIMKEQRRMIPMSSVSHIIARDHNWVYMSDPNNQISYLYDLNAEGDDRYANVWGEHQDVAKEMDTYVRAVIQAGWDMHNTPIAK